MTYMTGYVVFGIMFVGGLIAYAVFSRPLAELGEIAIAELVESEKKESESQGASSNA